ncbi:MAG: PqqD family protein [bacterium]
MIKNSEVLTLLKEHVGNHRFIPAQYFKKRYEADKELLIITFFQKGRSIRSHFLNKNGARIYELCDGEHSVNDIAQLLADEYPSVSQDALFENVIFIIRQLQRKDIIRHYS